MEGVYNNNATIKYQQLIILYNFTQLIPINKAILVVWLLGFK